jgi:hypothetical protein
MKSTHGVMALVFVLGVVGCAGPSHSVRKSDFRKAPHLASLGETARELGNKVYPEIVRILDAKDAPKHFDLVFKPLASRNTAEAHTASRKIYVNADYFATNYSQTHLENVLVHEMAHMAQQSPPHAPRHWVEGMADYVRYKMGYTNGSDGAECSYNYPHYMSGYCCAGAFLLHVDERHGAGVVRDLNAALRRNAYSDAFFLTATGRSLEDLWAGFQRTAAFTPVAAELNALYASLGYRFGETPSNVVLHAQAYAAEHLQGKLTREASGFLVSLKKEGKLPGFARDERGRLHPGIALPVRDDNSHPVTRTFVCEKASDKHSVYRYTVRRESEDAPWQLREAVRTRNGAVIETLPVN